MISITDRLMKMVRTGREGNNMGLTTGLIKLDNLVYGIQRSWMTIIAGGPGSGFEKTSRFKEESLKELLANIGGL